MSENQAEHAVATICRVLGVTEAGDSAWKRRAALKRAETRMAVFQYIEGWYNLRRRHSALGYQSPASDAEPV
ncbi:hypothetical protein HUA74_19340 [Myxococcus sp. CA051A]|uniref:hypothetical protein n=1 Tax=unclassified Myxococcus TaxID=2648731 RepID=UPI00157A8B0B|nr:MULTISPECIES: hypothetical protein [unclassified Myxococcus]NTX01809.1 hypothetical protein [Myxococcus sp. CA040A]NTX16450.1 hypothetical protein [Myxococcus sp. CA056]NTX50403.1 hypothetical protein [Myxococcus sp. CA039A]NTX62804.1 hypothetical protein [Myxococcus sp. CA051A]